MSDGRTDAKTLLLHVGVHKTATTTIQWILWRGVDRLAERRVGLLPRFDSAASIGWGDPLITNPGLLRGQLDGFRADPGLDAFVISHEDVLGVPFVAGRSGIYPDAERNLTALRAVTGPGRVMVTLRPQHEFVESFYLQHIHTGGSTSFEEFVSQIDLEALHWGPLVEVMDELYGRNNVVVLDFGLIRQGQDVFVRHFLDSTGLELGLDPHQPVSRNRSVSEHGLRMARAVNPLLDDSAQQRRLRDFLQGRFSNVDYPRPELFGEAQRAAVLARYEGEFRALVDRPGASLADPRSSPAAIAHTR